MNAIKALSERVLAMFLSEVDAGACVPGYGTICYCGDRGWHVRDCSGVCRLTYQPC